MSNETKRDVFNNLVEELADAYIALDGEGIGEELTNEDKQAYLKDYDAALPDETEKQKNCPYCHETAYSFSSLIFRPLFHK